MWASQYGHDNVVRALIQAGATVNTQNKVSEIICIKSFLQFILTYLQWGETALLTASFKGHWKCVQLLVDAEANVDVPKEVNVTSYTHISETEIKTLLAI